VCREELSPPIRLEHVAKHWKRCGNEKREGAESERPGCPSYVPGSDDREDYCDNPRPRTEHEPAAPGSRGAHDAVPGKIAISRTSLSHQFDRRRRRQILDDNSVFHLSARLVPRRSVPDLGRSPPGEPVRALSKPHFHGPDARLVEPALDRVQGTQGSPSPAPDRSARRLPAAHLDGRHAQSRKRRSADRHGRACGVRYYDPQLHEILPRVRRSADRGLQPTRSRSDPGC
jgi:hypothetical protein